MNATTRGAHNIALLQDLFPSRRVEGVIETVEQQKPVVPLLVEPLDVEPHASNTPAPFWPSETWTSAGRRRPPLKDISDGKEAAPHGEAHKTGRHFNPRTLKLDCRKRAQTSDGNKSNPSTRRL